MHQYANLSIKRLWVLAVMLLTACGGGSGVGTTDVIPNAVINITTINAFTLTGTSAPANGIVPINTGVNNGEFTIAWDVTSSNPYRVEVILSDDNVLGGDIEIYNRNCGTDSQVYTCSELGNFHCRFTNSNAMSCGIVTAFNPTKDLTTFLDVIPKSAFMILEACNALKDSCRIASVAIELQ